MNDAQAPETTAPTIPHTLPIAADRRRELGRLGCDFQTTDGQTWTLPDVGLAAAFTELRDRIDADATIYREIRPENTRAGAFLLLHEAYELTREEAVAIILNAADPTKLGQAVRDTICSADAPQDFTYTQWVRSSLLANNIDPRTISAHDLPFVLRQLIGTKRAMTHGDFTDAGEFAAKRNSLLALVK